MNHIHDRWQFNYKLEDKEYTVKATPNFEELSKYLTHCWSSLETQIANFEFREVLKVLRDKTLEEVLVFVLDEIHNRNMKDE